MMSDKCIHPKDGSTLIVAAQHLRGQKKKCVQFDTARVAQRYRCSGSCLNPIPNQQSARSLLHQRTEVLPEGNAHFR